MKRVWKIVKARIWLAWLVWRAGGTSSFGSECSKCGARSRDYYFEVCADMWSARHKCKKGGG
ncbi:MAG: hypothetical protein KJ648_07150 [Candidatus Omnitrophica bacterium]|nr:hypothetical protein [Candidatus Omnitrophota bacterium]